jgi:hypothetical protein
MTGPEFRASDEDRQRVVTALERHTAAGRLTLDEYTDRVDRALAARTHGDLARVTADLPGEPAEAPATPAGGAQLGVAFLVALVALVVVGGLVLLFR